LVLFFLLYHCLLVFFVFVLVSWTCIFHSFDIALCLCLCSLFFFLVVVVLACLLFFFVFVCVLCSWSCSLFLALGYCFGVLLFPLNSCP
jgi:hypothetical protein